MKNSGSKRNLFGIVFTVVWMFIAVGMATDKHTDYGWGGLLLLVVLAFIFAKASSFLAAVFSDTSRGAQLKKTSEHEDRGKEAM